MGVAVVRVACSLLVSFAAVLAATVGAFGASVPQGAVDPGASEKGPPPLSDVEVAALEERRRLLESPAAAAERVATRDRFAGLSDDAALVLARETFPGAASEPLAVGGRLGAGEAITA